MSDEFKIGDAVEWQTPQGATTGKIKKKLTAPTDIKDHHVAATADEPQYLVVSDKSGSQAAHKPESLKKLEK